MAVGLSAAMGKTRIRWRNVARLAAGAVVALVLVALTAAMLKPKPPQEAKRLVRRNKGVQ